MVQIVTVMLNKLIKNSLFAAHLGTELEEWMNITSTIRVNIWLVCIRDNQTVVKSVQNSITISVKLAYFKIIRGIILR